MLPLLVASPIVGTVVSAAGRAIDGDRTIVTDVVVRMPDGSETSYVEPGGSADGIAQVMWPGPAIPSPGDRISFRASAAGVIEDLSITEAAFVRTGPTKGGKYLAWASGCVFMTYEASGTADLAGDDEFGVLDEARANWNSADQGCSFVKLMSAGTKAVTPDKQIGNDGMNLIVFRDDQWVRPASEGMPEVNLPSGAAALTTVTYVDDASSSRDGEILDADMEINGAEYSISNDGVTLGNQGTCFADLDNTATHEMGHVLGLDHSCLAPGDPPKVDGAGNPVPECANTTDPTILNATMYNYQDCGETKKSSPEADDVAGVCAAYPKVDDPGSCDPVDTSPPGCCDTGGGAPGTLVTALAALALACRRRRSA